MRQGEILNLVWNHVDLENRLAHLEETKNGTARSVPFVDGVVNELNRLSIIRNPAKSHIFASKTTFGKIDINKAWNEALKRASVEGFIFHSIRHHFATFAARAGASNLQLKTALGHKSLQMLERYMHLDAQSSRHLSEKAEKHLRVVDHL